MRKYFLLFLFVSMTSSGFSQGIYNYSITNLNDSIIHLSSYQGKELLIVNTSLTDTLFNQYSQLNILSQLYKDSNVVIIAIGSNSFDSSLTSNTQLSALYNNLHLNYIMSKIMTVDGENADPLYQWLTQKSKNGVADVPSLGDYFKFLIDVNGNLKGWFSGRVLPMSPVIADAILIH